MLTDEEREALVKYRIEKAYGTVIENMRKTGNYDDFIEWHQEDVEPLFPPVVAYIEKVKGLVEQKKE